MYYTSTRNNEVKLRSTQAVIKGLSDDGGLLVPSEIPQLCISPLTLASMNYNEILLSVMDALLPDFGKDTLKKCIEEGYKGKFSAPQNAKISYAAGEAFLELYHGPTCAFKDMALCILPRLLAAANKMEGNNNEILILTATSGDTGKAALASFADAPGTKIMVFYPSEGVSDIQKLQMQTQEGSNVYVAAIEGNFDDAQTAVKKAMGRVKLEGIDLGSANSINIGRLVPQVAYYFWAYGQLVKDNKIFAGQLLNFAVPTGNFGDILAGWIAKRMGLPVGKLLCASNKNNILTDFIKTGVYDTGREFYTTASPSMDILVSSNLERLLYFVSGRDDEYVSQLMGNLSLNGRFSVNGDILEAIQEDFDAAFADDDKCFEAIADAFKQDYLTDTHTAVAFACCKAEYGDNLTVVLSTASPYKFSYDVLRALGQDAPADPFEAMDMLEKLSGIPAPSGLKNLKAKKPLHTDVIKASEIEEYIKRKING